MDEAFSFFSTPKNDIPLAKFDFESFNESDSGFLSDFVSPDKSCEKEKNVSKSKIVTFKEPPEKIMKKSHEDIKSTSVQSSSQSSDKNKLAVDSIENSKPVSENADPTDFDLIVGATKASSSGKYDNDASLEDYFKHLLGEVAEEMCKKALKHLVEIEQFEKACPHVLDDLLKDAKKLEAKLIKEKMALKKRVERLMNAFSV